MVVVLLLLGFLLSLHPHLPALLYQVVVSPWVLPRQCSGVPRRRAGGVVCVYAPLAVAAVQQTVNLVLVESLGHRLCREMAAALRLRSGTRPLEGGVSMTLNI